MSNALFYEDCALNYTQSPLDDSITSGCKGWSSAKINCLMDSAHSEINETIQTCHNAVVSCLNSSVTSINTDLSNKYAVCCDSCVRIGQNSCVGNYGVSIGYGAGSYSSSYMYTVAIGGTARALGNYGISVGYQAGASFTGANNLAIGTYAMYGASGATGCNNTAIGYNALRNIQGTANNDNTAIGSSALQAMTTGLYNTAIGARALCGLTTGCENFGLGIDTGWAITTGCNNVLIGNNTGMGIKGNSSENVLIGKNVACTGSYAVCGNTIIGSKAGTEVASHENTVIGYTAGQILCGSTNTFIGAYANCTSLACNPKISSAVAIGASANSDCYSVAVGNHSCTSMCSVAVGFGACACSFGVSLGKGATVNRNSGIAIGYNAQVNSIGRIAIGLCAKADSFCDFQIEAHTSSLTSIHIERDMQQCAVFNCLLCLFHPTGSISYTQCFCTVIGQATVYCGGDYYSCLLQHYLLEDFSCCNHYYEFFVSHCHCSCNHKTVYIWLDCTKCVGTDIDALIYTSR